MEKGLTHDGWDKKTNRPEFLSEGKHTIIEDILGESPTAKIWGLLWEWQTWAEGTKSDIAQCAGISRTSLYKVLPWFLENEIIIPSKYEKGVQYYKFNKNHYLADQMLTLLHLFIYDNIEKTMVMEEVKNKLAKQYKKIKAKKTQIKNNK